MITAEHENDRHDQHLTVLSTCLTSMIMMGIVLPFMLWGWNSQAIMDRVCDLDRSPYGLLIQEALLTYLILSVTCLGVAYLRGRGLRRKISLHRSAEHRALELARDDVLTRLLNRRAFMEELNAEILQPGRTLVVALIDLDDFKTINDIQGHAAGDATLQCVARRLSAVLGDQGIAARLGGDEFAVLIRIDDAALQPDSVVKKLSDDLQRSSALRSDAAHAGASIGAAVFPNDAQTAEALLRAADMAMYCAKRAGGNDLRFFSPAMVAERNEHRCRVDELRHGIANGELCPYYQPVIDLADGTVAGFEVLARWQHPRLGLLAPNEFLALVEASGQTTALTESLLRQACMDLGPLPAPLRFAVNVSPTQFAEPLLAERLLNIVRGAGVSPNRIEIEITEDALMGDIAAAAAVIATFRETGMTVALDDFGTGFSNLSNLHRLSIDRLKIDRSFVGTMLENEGSRKLVEVILDLGRHFNLAVTAEGIESGAIAALLSERGCTQGQGFFYGQPMPLAAAKEHVHRRMQLASRTEPSKSRATA